MNFVAVGRIFNRVGHKINDDLLNPHFVTKNFSIDTSFFNELHFGIGLLHDLHNMIQNLIEIEVLFIEFEFAAFNFRDIE